MRDSLRELARDAWQEHRRAERERVPHLVMPSSPILFFGDSQHFASSPLRVITVGLNPSREEFPRGAPFMRFPQSAAYGGDELDAYLAGLDEYFRADPYTGWFNPSFEPLLRGMGASYYDGAPSRSSSTWSSRSTSRSTSGTHAAGTARASTGAAGRICRSGTAMQVLSRGIFTHLDCPLLGSDSSMEMNALQCAPFSHEPSRHDATLHGSARRYPD